MSAIYDSLKELEKGNSTISQALNKQQSGKNGNGNPDVPPPDAPQQPQAEGTQDPEKKNGGGFSLAIFSLFLMMAVTAAVVVVFSFRTIDKVGTASRVTEQLEVLLDDQVKELTALKDHLTAVEQEFRRAFKKDRDQIMEMEKKFSALDVKLTAAVQDSRAGLAKELREEFQSELLKHKSVLTDQESRNAKAARDYEDLIRRFANIQEEFNSLRAKVVGITVP
jgi:hypothetical protein